MTHTLGRVPSPPDPRDGNYPARRLLRTLEPERQHRKWYTEHLRLDQGKIGQCTTVSAAHLLAAGPVTQRPYYGGVPEIDTVQAYCRAQELDGVTRTWCTDRNDTGATMRSAAEVLRERGYAENYWWLSGLDEVVAHLTNRGPVWIGTYWRGDMWKPDSRGFVHAAGTYDGGHAYLLDEVANRGRYVWLLNNWGTKWAHRGRARLSFADLAVLLAEDGEAVAITERRTP